MKTSKVTKQIMSVSMVGLVAMSACNTQTPTPSDEGPSATVGLALSGANFAYNSVLIHAYRSTTADPKYPCTSDTTVCFDFDAEGHPINPYTYENGFESLCPTEDLSSDGYTGTWTFTYEIHTQPQCYGPVLNDGTHNFTCYDIDDIFTQNHPNATVGEVLYQGYNKNTIICSSVDAQKTFDFNSCEQLSPAPYLLLDCGCSLKNPYYPALGCVCSQFDSTPDLPEHCVFDDKCNIDCQAYNP